jgi:hypothetical protein
VAKGGANALPTNTDLQSFRLSGVYRPAYGLNLIGTAEKLSKIGRASPASLFARR